MEIVWLIAGATLLLTAMLGARRAAVAGGSGLALGLSLLVRPPMDRMRRRRQGVH